MIKISYDPSNTAIKAKGHAGYAEQGKDIVCASVSTLFFTCGLALLERGIHMETRGEADLGDLYIRAYPEAEECYPCTVIFETIKAGLEAMAIRYPKHVKMSIEEVK